jgi:hypothetical protein
VGYSGLDLLGHVGNKEKEKINKKAAGLRRDWAGWLALVRGNWAAHAVRKGEKTGPCG